MKNNKPLITGKQKKLPAIRKSVKKLQPTGSNLNKLLDLFKMTDLELLDHLHDLIMNTYRYHDIVTDNINYLYAKGLDPYCLVGHVDIVGRIPPTNFHIEFKNNGSTEITASPAGILGADDRAGIFAILELLERGLRPSLLFTNGEETGGTGVKKFLIDQALMSFDHIRFFVELDRAGDNDYVFYSSRIASELRDMVEDAGFVFDHGSYSDVADLTESTLIAHVNLSIGYYNQHTKREMLSWHELSEIIDRVYHMLNEHTLFITGQLLLDPFNDDLFDERLNVFDDNYLGEW